MKPFLGQFAASAFVAIFFLAVCAAALLSPPPAMALSKRAYRGLRKLDPQVRLEQVCDLAVMSRIAHDKKKFRPDRAKSNILSLPMHHGDTLRASGAAFRSRGKWYALSFVCKGSPDHMKVLSLKYKIGKPIPHSQWASLGLWD